MDAACFAHLNQIGNCAGELEPSQGEFRRSHTLRVARYAQHFVDALQMDESPVEYLLHKFPQVRGRIIKGFITAAACMQAWLRSPVIWQKRIAHCPGCVPDWRSCQRQADCTRHCLHWAARTVPFCMKHTHG